MNPRCHQRLFNGSRQISREGMGLGRAWRQRLPGDEIGRRLRVTFPEIQESNERHELFSFPFQHAERDGPNRQRQPKRNASISQSDDHGVTPGDTQRRKRQGHNPFDNADPRRRGRHDQEKIGNGETTDDGPAENGT